MTTPNIDPVAHSLERLQTMLIWIDEHRAAVEKGDPTTVKAELNNLHDATEQAAWHLGRLTELLLAGVTVDPAKTLPKGLGSQVWQHWLQRVAEKRAR